MPAWSTQHVVTILVGCDCYFFYVWELLLGYKAMLVLIGIHGASSSSRCMAIMRTSLPATFSYSLISASALSGSQKGHGLTRDAMVNSYGQLSSQTDTYAHANHYYIVYLSCALACEIFTCPLHKIICICICICICMYVCIALFVDKFDVVRQLDAKCCKMKPASACWMRKMTI